jgi:hypothetical protein
MILIPFRCAFQNLSIAGKDSLGEKSKPILVSLHDFKNETFCDYQNDEKLVDEA